MQCIARGAAPPTMAARLNFRWNLWPTLAAAAGIALTVALGFWQYGRGQEKAALSARIERLAQEPPVHVAERELDARDVELRRVEARGEFEPKHALLLDNRVWRGRVGYQVVMPLRLGESGRYVLVNRGWIAAEPDRARLPEVKTPRRGAKPPLSRTVGRGCAGPGMAEPYHRALSRCDADRDPAFRDTAA